jgi:cytochrome c-type biogenesis protein CcmH
MKTSVKIAAALIAGAALLGAPGAFAIDNNPPLPDPKLQQRYLDLTHELRCMQCQNESLADSPVGLASDLRRDVREQILAGATDEQIRDLMVSRYGEFILFRPRLNARTAWLWFAPVLLMIVGVLIAVRVVRDRQRRVEVLGPPDEDTARAESSDP